MIFDTAWAQVYLVIFLAFFAGGWVKGSVGVGLPLVSVPLMATVLPPTTAIALPIIPVLFSNIWQTLESGYGLSALKRFWALYLCVIITTIAGGQLLVSFATDTIAFMLGAMLIVFVLLQSLSPTVTISPRAEPWLNPIIGACAGFIGGISSFFGPIPVAYLLLRLPKDAFIGTIAIFYLIACSTLYSLLAVHELLTTTELILSLLALPPLFLGLISGRRLRHRISQATFVKLLNTVLLLIGLALISKSYQ